MKIRLGGAGLIYADREAGGRTDMTKVTGPLRDWHKNAPKILTLTDEFFPHYVENKINLLSFSRKVPDIDVLF
jgi:hypothetical protein